MVFELAVIEAGLAHDLAHAFWAALLRAAPCAFMRVVRTPTSILNSAAAALSPSSATVPPDTNSSSLSSNCRPVLLMLFSIQEALTIRPLFGHTDATLSSLV